MRIDIKKDSTYKNINAGDLILTDVDAYIVVTDIEDNYNVIILSDNSLLSCSFTNTNDLQDYIKDAYGENILDVIPAYELKLTKNS